MDANVNATVSFASLIVLGLSSGFFAGLVSSVVNLIIAHFDRKNELAVESEKYQHSINDYRYKEIHKYLKNICDIPSKKYVVQSEEEQMELIKASNDEDEQIMSIYRGALPLLDKSLKEPLEAARNEVDTISSAMVVQLFNGEKSDSSHFNLIQLIQSRDAFKAVIIEKLQEQLTSLLAQNNDTYK